MCTHVQQVSTDEKEATKKKGTELMTEEEAKTGRVHASILVAYCKACTWPVVIITLLIYVFTNVSSVAGNFWVAAWSNAEDRSTLGDGNFTQSTACDGVNGTIV